MREKRCPRCAMFKHHHDFNVSSSSHDGLQAYCRECNRAYQREWHSRNADRRRVDAVRNNLLNREDKKRQNARNRQEKKELLDAYKSERGCMVCGVTVPEVGVEQLHFHHLPGRRKSFGLGSNGKNHGMKTLLVEMAKCEVVCVECHRLHHSREADMRAARRLAELAERAS